MGDFGAFPGAAFFVDDDWIAATLDQAGIGRVVLGMDRIGRSAKVLFETPVVSEAIASLASLNGKAHAFRNIGFQETALAFFRDQGRFDNSSIRFPSCRTMPSTT